MQQRTVLQLRTDGKLRITRERQDGTMWTVVDKFSITDPNQIKDCGYAWRRQVKEWLQASAPVEPGPVTFSALEPIEGD